MSQAKQCVCWAPHPALLMMKKEAHSILWSTLQSHDYLLKLIQMKYPMFPTLSHYLSLSCGMFQNICRFAPDYIHLLRKLRDLSRFGAWTHYPVPFRRRRWGSASLSLGTALNFETEGIWKMWDGTVRIAERRKSRVDNYKRGRQATHRKGFRLYWDNHVVRLMPVPVMRDLRQGWFQETIRKMTQMSKELGRNQGDEWWSFFVTPHHQIYTLCTGAGIHMLLTVAPQKTLPSASLFKAKPAASRCIFETLDSLPLSDLLKTVCHVRQHSCGKGELPQMHTFKALIGCHRWASSMLSLGWGKAMTGHSPTIGNTSTNRKRDLNAQ